MTVKLYVVVVAGESDIFELLRVGYVKVIHVSEGEKIALVPLAYDALSVRDCPASIVAALAAKVQLGPVGLVPVPFPVPIPVQLIPQCPTVPLSTHSSQDSFCPVESGCHARNVPPCVWIPPFPSVVPVGLSTIPSPHLAT